MLLLNGIADEIEDDSHGDSPYSTYDIDVCEVASLRERSSEWDLFHGATKSGTVFPVESHSLASTSYKVPSPVAV
jgi:hypothetical protein